MNFERYYLPMLSAALLLQAFLMWVVGDVYVNGHEIDVLHSLQGALRLADGERPHLDFATPLGVLTFAPIAVLVKLGFGYGGAMAYSGVFVALVFLPALVWVGKTRLSGGVLWVWGAGIIVLMTASVFGSVDDSNSYSMHYNRWAWGAVFILLTAVILPNRTRRSFWADGLVIGGCLVFLALTKITFFVAFFPVIVIALLAQMHWKTFLIAAFVGITSVLSITIWAGSIDYWFGYISDLNMAGSANFSLRSGGWDRFITRPIMIVSASAMLIGASFMSRSGDTFKGAMLLLLTPAFLFCTYYNWGLEPKFLLFLALVIWVSGRKSTTATVALPLMFVAILAPSLVNISLSNIRPLTFDRTEFFPALAEDRRGALMFHKERTFDRAVTLLSDDDILEIHELDGTVTEVENCSLGLGALGQTFAIVDSLKSLGLDDGSAILVADVFSNYWMYGNFGRLQGGAIWQYDAIHGIEDADILIVPDCASRLESRTAILDGIQQAELGLSLIERTEIARIYRIVR